MKQILAFSLTCVLSMSVLASPVRSNLASREISTASSASIPTAKDYIQDGLIAMWDGIENAGWGQHDSFSSVWVDLVGNRDATLASFAHFSNNALVCDSRDISVDKGAMAQTAANTYIPEPIGDLTYTIELCFLRDASFTEFIGEGMTIFAVGSNSPGGYNSRWGVIGTGKSYGLNRLSHSGHNGGVRDISNYFATQYGKVPTCHTKMYNASYSTGGAYTDVIYWRNGIQETYNGSGGSRCRARSSGVSFGGNGATEGICGQVCFVRIYNRALTEEEIMYNHKIDKVRFNLPK